MVMFFLAQTVDEPYYRDFFDNLSIWLDAHLINIGLILFVTWLIRKIGPPFIMRVIKGTVRTDLYPTEVDRKKRMQTLQSLVAAVFKVGTWMLAFLLIISELKPSYAATLFTSAGIVGFGLAFGAQSLIKDFVNGMFIIFENQYRVGDIVTINNVSGKVEGITMRTTIIRDLNGYVYHIPNGSITLTTNQTMDYGRIYEDIKVKPDTDIVLLEKTINLAGEKVADMAKFEHKISEPPAFERVSSIGSEGITVKVLGKVSLSEQKQIKSEFLKQLKKEFDKAKIKM